MKRTLVAVLFAAGLLSLAACQSGKKSDQTQDTTSVQMEQPAAQSAAPADSTQAADTTKAQ